MARTAVSRLAASRWLNPLLLISLVCVWVAMLYLTVPPPLSGRRFH